MDKPIGLLIGVAVVVGVVLGWTGVVASALTLVAVRLLGFRWSRWLPVVLVAGSFLGATAGALQQPQSSSADIGMSDRATGSIVTMPVARPNGDRVVLHVDAVEIENVSRQADVRVVVFLPQDANVTVGDHVTVVWKATPVDRVEPGFAGFIRSQGAVATARVYAVTDGESGRSLLRWLVGVRRAISDRFADLEAGDTGALMSGLVTGDDSRLSDATRDAFFVTGTAHITAVSGSNVAMLAALWYRWLARSRRQRLWVAAGLVSTIWLYCAMTGLEPSAVRAAAVATMVVGGVLVGRRADPMTAVSLVTAALLIIRPEWQTSVGFWLSTAASGALAWRFREGGDHSIAMTIRDTIAGLAMAQCATLPIIAWTFGTVTPAGIVANLVLSPVMAIAFPLTFAYCLVAFVPGISTALLFLPAAPNDVAIGVVSRLAAVAPVWQLDLSSPLALGLVALPCLAIVAGASADAQRWWNRANARRSGSRVR